MRMENIWSAAAAADYSATQYLFATVNGSGQVATVSVAGNQAIGVIDNAPASGEQARVVWGGVRKITAGTGGLSLGQTVSSDANGKGVNDATSGHYYMGVCTVAASAGNVAQFVWSPGKI